MLVKFFSVQIGPLLFEIGNQIVCQPKVRWDCCERASLSLVFMFIGIVLFSRLNGSV